MATLRLELIGIPRILVDGTERTPGPKPLLLVVYLALEQRPIGRERIIELLWPGVDESRARRTLRSTLSALRATVHEKLIAAERDTLAIGAEMVVTSDLHDLQALADGTVRSDDVRFADDTPPSLLHARFLDGVRTEGSEELDEWFTRLSSRVEMLQDEVNDRLVRELSERDRLAAAQALAEAWFARDRSFEGAAVARMEVAAARSRRADVAEAYQAHVRALAALDDEPSVEVTRLYQRLAGLEDASRGEGDPAGAATAAADKTSAYPQGLRRSGNLPVPRDRFVGRDAEVAECLRALRTNAILTIWAAGGAGKTRLAVELGHALVPDYADGVRFVALGEVDGGDLVPDAIAAALGITRESGIALEDTIAAFLADRHLVLVLDNCEHVCEECARIVATIAAEIRDSRVIVTSREPLEVAEEHVIRLLPLGVPDEERVSGQTDDLFDAPAVELFVDRAMRYDPGFSLTEENSASVVAICRRVDGLPLALEIAAAALRTLSVDEIARSLDERFAELARATRSHAVAHNTIREVISWSHRLLSEGAAALFARVSVFPAAFTLEAAEFVCSDLEDGDTVSRRSVLSFLDELIRKSLVVVRREGGRSTYSLFQLVRLFASQSLHDARSADRLRGRLLEWVMKFGEETIATHFGSGVSDTASRMHFREVERFRMELPSVRAAVEYAIASSRVTEALSVLTDLDLYWWSESLAVEALGYLIRLMPELPGAPPWLQVCAYADAAGYRRTLGEPSTEPSLSRVYIESGLAVDLPPFPDPGSPRAQHTRAKLAFLCWQMAESSHAHTNWHELAERTLELGRSLNPRQTLQCLVRVANVYERRGEHSRAAALMDEAEAMDVVDHERFTLGAGWLGRQSRVGEAADRVRSGLRTAAGRHYWSRGALIQLLSVGSEILRANGDVGGFLAFSAFSLRQAWDSGARVVAYGQASYLLYAYIDAGNAARAERFAAFRMKIRERLPPELQGEADEFERNEPKLPEELALDPERLQSEQVAGATMSVYEAVELCRSDAEQLAADDATIREWLDLLDAAVAAVFGPA